jgi:hypothetical protein
MSGVQTANLIPSIGEQVHRATACLIAVGRARDIDLNTCTIANGNRNRDSRGFKSSFFRSEHPADFHAIATSPRVR